MLSRSLEQMALLEKLGAIRNRATISLRSRTRATITSQAFPLNTSTMSTETPEVEQVLRF